MGLIPTKPESNNVSSGSADPSCCDTRIIGIGVGVGLTFLVIAVVILVLLFIWRKKRITSRKNEENGEGVPPFEPVLPDWPKRNPNPIKVVDFLKLLGERRQNKEIYLDEFKSLPPVTLPRIKSCSVAEKHRPRNRYLDILPYNEDRVKLEGSDKDYINASFIDGYDKKRAYIATQGPLNTTCDHFWSMVWEQKCNKIIMVANLFEDGVSKCAQYFPRTINDEPPEPMTFKSFVISLVSEDENTDYITRTLNVQKKGENRTVHQFHYKQWPDQGVPDNSTSLIKFYKASFERDETDSAPIVIHCSAGVGRTGTLLAVDIISDQVKKEGKLDVALCVDVMRRNRVAMVQTLAQYIFTHFTVAEMLLLGDVSIPRSRFHEYFVDLDERNSFDCSNLKLQFDFLNASKPIFTELSYIQGSVDEFKPYLEPNEEEKNINAVFVGSHTTKERFIVTHAPMKNTINKFWELVKEHNCLTIVMLNDVLIEDGQYWPADGQSEEHKGLKISNVGEISGDNVVLSQLQISNSTAPREESLGVLNHGAQLEETEEVQPSISSSEDHDSLNVRHIRISGWPESEPVEKRMDSLLSLVCEGIKCAERNPNTPILVHCMNGTDRSGLFCALYCILEKLLTNGEVDVFNSVKKIQKNRPEFISDIEQLRSLYEIADYHLSNADNV